MIDITDIRIRKTKNKSGKMKAVVSITIDGCFVVHEIKIIEGSTRTFVSMPSKKNNSGNFKDTAHPISTETRQYIENKILDKYHLLEAEEKEDTLIQANEEYTYETI